MGKMKKIVNHFYISTAMDIWLHTIAILWSKFALFGRAWRTLKALPCPWLSDQTTARHQSFQMKYYRTLYLTGFHSCRPSKLAVKKKSWYFVFEATFFAILHSNRRGPGLIPGRADFEGLQLCSPLSYSDMWHLFGNLLPTQGRGSAFEVRHALLRSAILLSIY